MIYKILQPVFVWRDVISYPPLFFVFVFFFLSFFVFVFRFLFFTGFDQRDAVA